MSVYDERREELEQQEFMMGAERGRLSVTLDLLDRRAGAGGTARRLLPERAAARQAGHGYTDDLEIA